MEDGLINPRYIYFCFTSLSFFFYDVLVDFATLIISMGVYLYVR